MARLGPVKRLLRIFWCRRQTTLGLISCLIVLIIWTNLHLLSCVTENSEQASNIKGIYPSSQPSTTRQTTSGPAAFQVEASRLTVDPKKALLYGRMRPNRSELTIGIPTVQRRGVDYLEKTLYSLITHSKASQRSSIVVVIFMVDRNETWTSIRSKQLAGKYPRLIKNGFLQIVRPHDQSIYPDFTKLKRTFNDTAARVTWRSKQNIDYAYLFSYCKGISRYYLQLEDDVIAASNYYDDIMNFIESKSTTFWYCLEFSFLGFIGKLLRSSDLQELSEYILMFFDEQPGDLLLKALKTIKTQWKDIQMKKSLFQHKGVVSSLTDKEQHLYDGHFKDGFRFNQYSRKRFYHVNPSAMIDSKIDTYSDYEPMHAYDLSDKYFWGVDPKQGDYFRITFEGPQNISRLFIDSGEVTKTSDRLHHARLLVSTAIDIDKPCQNLVNITNFIDGDVDTRKSNISLPSNIDCIVIEITANQSDWVIIREIAVFLPGEQEIEEQRKEEKVPQPQGESEMLKWQIWKRHEPFKPAFLSPRFENGVLVMPDQNVDRNWQDQKLLHDNRQKSQNQNQQQVEVWGERNEPGRNSNQQMNNVNINRQEQIRNIIDRQQKHESPEGVILSKNNQHLLELWQHQVNMNKLLMKMSGMRQDKLLLKRPSPNIENEPIPQHILNRQVEMDGKVNNNVPLHNRPAHMGNKQFEMDDLPQNNVPRHNRPPPRMENMQLGIGDKAQKMVPHHIKAGQHIGNMKRHKLRQPNKQIQGNLQNQP